MSSAPQHPEAISLPPVVRSLLGLIALKPPISNSFRCRHKTPRGRSMRLGGPVACMYR